MLNRKKVLDALKAGYHPLWARESFRPEHESNSHLEPRKDRQIV